MAGANLSIVISAQDTASAVFNKVIQSAGGLGSKLSSAFAGIGAAGMAIGGIAAIGQAVAGVATSMIDGNAKMEMYETQLGTLMGSSDKAKERIAQLAKIGAETPFELTELVKAEKIMMGFGLNTEKTMQLTGLSLDQYRTAIGDMAAATGAPLDEVTLLWSKFGSGATGEAISRLQELGIVTREQMAAMGIEFSKSGELVSPVPQAMAVAMKIANEKMGGGMKALSSTFEGQMSTLADNFNQAKVILMAPIFDVLKTSLTGVNELLSSETFTSSIKSMAEQGAVAIDWLIGLIINLGSVLSGDLNGNVEAAAEMLRQFLPEDVINSIINIVYDLGETFRSVMGGDIMGSVEGALNIIDDFGSLIAASIESWASSFASWVDGADSGMTDGLADLLIGLQTWIQTAGFAIIERLAIWAGAFVDWVGPKIPPLLAELGSLLAQLLGWVLSTGLPNLIGKLAEWGLALVEWVAPRIGPLLAALGGLLVALGGWLLGTALPAIVSQLLQWGDAFTAWVIPMIPQLILQLMILQGQLITWIAGQVAGIGVALVAWGLAFIGWVATDVLPALPGALAGIMTAITGWISSAAGAVQSAAAGIGQSMVDGIRAGIINAASSLASSAADVVRGALEAARSAIDSNSPSKVFAEKIGKPMVQGIVMGIDNASGSLDARMGSLVQPPAVSQGGGGGAYGGGASVVNITVQGSLIHERELQQMITGAVGGGLRSGARLI